MTKKQKRQSALLGASTASDPVNAGSPFSTLIRNTYVQFSKPERNYCNLEKVKGMLVLILNRESFIGTGSRLFKIEMFPLQKRFEQRTFADYALENKLVRKELIYSNHGIIFNADELMDIVAEAERSAGSCCTECADSDHVADGTGREAHVDGKCPDIVLKIPFSYDLNEYDYGSHLFGPKALGDVNRVFVTRSVRFYVRSLIYITAKDEDMVKFSKDSEFLRTLCSSDSRFWEMVQESQEEAKEIPEARATEMFRDEYIRMQMNLEKYVYRRGEKLTVRLRVNESCVHPDKFLLRKVMVRCKQRLQTRFKTEEGDWVSRKFFKTFGSKKFSLQPNRSRGRAGSSTSSPLARLSAANSASASNTSKSRLQRQLDSEDILDLGVSFSLDMNDMARVNYNKGTNSGEYANRSGMGPLCNNLLNELGTTGTNTGTYMGMEVDYLVEAEFHFTTGYFGKMVKRTLQAPFVIQCSPCKVHGVEHGFEGEQTLSRNATPSSSVGSCTSPSRRTERGDSVTSESGVVFDDSVSCDESFCGFFEEKDIPEDSQSLFSGDSVGGASFDGRERSESAGPKPQCESNQVMSGKKRSLSAGDLVPQTPVKDGAQTEKIPEKSPSEGNTTRPSADHVELCPNYDEAGHKCEFPCCSSFSSGGEEDAVKVDHKENTARVELLPKHDPNCPTVPLKHACHPRTESEAGGGNFDAFSDIFSSSPVSSTRNSLCEELDMGKSKYSRTYASGRSCSASCSFPQQQTSTPSTDEKQLLTVQTSTCRRCSMPENVAVTFSNTTETTDKEETSGTGGRKVSIVNLAGAKLKSLSLSSQG